MKGLGHSFKHAIRGFFVAVNGGRNLKIHLLATVLVMSAAFFFGLEPWALAVLTLTCALVIAAEIFNTAIERLCDKVSPDVCPVIKDIKDMAAGAVLVCAAASVAVAIFVFIIGRIW